MQYPELGRGSIDDHRNMVRSREVRDPNDNRYHAGCEPNCNSGPYSRKTLHVQSDTGGVAKVSSYRHLGTYCSTSSHRGVASTVLSPPWYHPDRAGHYADSCVFKYA